MVSPAMYPNHLEVTNEQYNWYSAKKN